jgi:hypothetical protein
MNIFKPKIALFGKHSNRTPFAYNTYKRFLSQSFEFVDLDENPQLIITGFSKDFFDSFENRLETFQRSQKAKLLVVSEEPLWDLIYASQYQDNISETVATIKNSDEEFHCFNYFNSNLFEFTGVPYYLTTATDYVSRYTVLINSVLSRYSSSFFAERINSPVFGMFERRVDPWFDINTANAKCLCIYRSLFAEHLGIHANIQGVGHRASYSPRQLLPDWHLDKLAKAYMKYSLVISMENTCHNNYVSEKIFDAYAVGAIPIYYAPLNHSVHTTLGLSSFFDVSIMEPMDAASALIEYKSRINDKVDSFFHDLRHIMFRVLDPVNYWDEIKTRSDCLSNLVLKCL